MERYLPKTYHVRYGISDPTFTEFEAYFYQLQKRYDKEFLQSGVVRYNAWIVKPGENTNRGKGIAVYDTLSQIKNKVMRSFVSR
jgi:tubulin--tyrosine ligase